MTPQDKAYYSDGYYPLFKLMSDEFGLTLLEQDMSEIMSCVRKMDEARKPESKKDWLLFFSEWYSILVTSIVTGFLVLMAIFGGHFDAEIYFNSFSELIKTLKR